MLTLKIESTVFAVVVVLCCRQLNSVRCGLVVIKGDDNVVANVEDSNVHLPEKAPGLQWIPLFPRQHWQDLRMNAFWKDDLNDGVENRIDSDKVFGDNIKQKIQSKFPKLHNQGSAFQEQSQSVTSDGEQHFSASFLERDEHIGTSSDGKPSSKTIKIETTSVGGNKSVIIPDGEIAVIQVSGKSKQSQSLLSPGLGQTQSSVTSDGKGNIQFSSSFSVNGGKTIVQSQGQSSGQDNGISQQQSQSFLSSNANNIRSSTSLNGINSSVQFESSEPAKGLSEHLTGPARGLGKGTKLVQTQSLGGFDQETTRHSILPASNRKPTREEHSSASFLERGEHIGTSIDGQTYSKTINVETTSVGGNKNVIIPDALGLGQTQSSISSEGKGRTQISSSSSVNGGKIIVQSQSSGEKNEIIKQQSQSVFSSDVNNINTSTILNGIHSTVQTVSSGPAKALTEHLLLPSNGSKYDKTADSVIRTGAGLEKATKVVQTQSLGGFGQQQTTNTDNRSIRKIVIEPLEPRGSIVLESNRKPASFLSVQQTNSVKDEAGVILQNDGDATNILAIGGRNRIRGGLRARRRLRETLNLNEVVKSDPAKVVIVRPVVIATAPTNIQEQDQIFGFRGRLRGGLRRARRRFRRRGVVTLTREPVVVIPAVEAKTTIRLTNENNGKKEDINSGLKVIRNFKTPTEVVIGINSSVQSQSSGSSERLSEHLSSTSKGSKSDQTAERTGRTGLGLEKITKVVETQSLGGFGQQQTTNTDNGKRKPTSILAVQQIESGKAGVNPATVLQKEVQNISSSAGDATNILDKRERDRIVGGLRARRRLRESLNLNEEVKSEPAKVVIVRPAVIASAPILTNIQEQDQYVEIRGRLLSGLRRERRRLRRRGVVNLTSDQVVVVPSVGAETNINSGLKNIKSSKQENVELEPSKVVINSSVQSLSSGSSQSLSEHLSSTSKGFKSDNSAEGFIKPGPGREKTTKVMQTQTLGGLRQQQTTTTGNGSIRKIIVGPLEPRGSIVLASNRKPTSFLAFQQTEPAKAGAGVNPAVILQKKGQHISTSEETNISLSTQFNGEKEDVLKADHSLENDFILDSNLKSGQQGNIELTPTKVVIAHPCGSQTTLATTDGLSTEIGSLISKGLNLKSNLASSLSTGALATGNIVPISVPINLGVVTQVGTLNSSAVSAATAIGGGKAAAAASSSAISASSGDDAVSIAIAKSTSDSAPQLTIDSVKPIGVRPPCAKNITSDDLSETDGDDKIGILGL